MRKDKEKFKIIEETFDEERNSMYEKLTKTVSEVDAQKKKYDEMQHFLSAAREDISKLELENAKLKEQVSTEQGIFAYFLITRLLLIGLKRQNPLLIVCFRSPQTLLVLQMLYISWMRTPMMMMMIVMIVILIPLLMTTKQSAIFSLMTSMTYQISLMIPPSM